jgi:hypothetical protein
VLTFPFRALPPGETRAAAQREGARDSAAKKGELSFAPRFAFLAFNL